MLDVFKPLAPEARRENRAAYQKFLSDRDGAMDIEKRQLARREAGMVRYERPLSRIREIHCGLFDAHYASFDAKVATPPEMLLLLALTKANACEAFGVNQIFEGVLRKAIKNDDVCELTLMIEETYHTRILVSTSLSYGIEMTKPYTPPVSLRTLISTVGIAPELVARPITLAAEVLGLITFINLLESAREVLRHDPELRDAVEERLCEIITDELGHMSYNRACLGPTGIAQAKFLFPFIARGVGGVVPEIRALGASATASDENVAGITSPKRLPAAVLKSAYIS